MCSLGEAEFMFWFVCSLILLFIMWYTCFLFILSLLLVMNVMRVLGARNSRVGCSCIRVQGCSCLVFSFRVGSV